MLWRALNRLSATGFLLKDGAGPGRDMLLDMEGGPSLAEALAKAGSSFGRIAHLFVTHFHADHFHPVEALDLARGGTRIWMGRASWLALREHLARLPGSGGALDACVELERSGALGLLDPCGETTVCGHSVAWAPFPHGDGDRTCENLAFRIDDHLFTGDVSVRAMFDKPDAPARGLPGGGAVKVFCVNIAQISREDIAMMADLPPRRVRNYLHNHGILEDLLAAVADPALAGFFGSLEEIVPHHLRREPLEETATTIAAALLSAGRKMGYRFRVIFE